MDEHIRKFIAVAEHGGFTKAAKAVHVSQPALSVSIRDLEKRLGAALFNRSGRRVTLTPAGHKLYASAQQVDDIMQNVQLEITQLADKPPRLRLGLIDTVANQLFVRRNCAGDLASHVDLSIMVDRSAQLLEGVRNGSIDGAFVTFQAQRLEPGVQQELVGSEPLITVSSSLTSFNTNKSYPYISYNLGSTTGQLIAEALEQRGFSYKTVFYSTSPEIILHQCLNGVGAATLPFAMVETHLQESRLEPLFKRVDNIIERDISFVQRRDRVLPARLGRLRENATEALHADTDRAKAYAF
jgi:DNA-binding transcriptional LysR family regulator